MSDIRQTSTLTLLRRLSTIADPSAPGYIPDYFVQLCDGISLYAALRIVAPNNFPPTTITSIIGDDGEESTTMLSLTSKHFEVDAAVRKANLSVLMQRITQYAQEMIVPTSGVAPVTQGLDAVALAALAGDGSDGALCTAEVPESLMQLVGLAVTLVVLSGVQSVLAEVKALPRPDQVVLSDWVREIMGTYNLKPRRHVTAAAAQPNSKPFDNNNNSTAGRAAAAIGSPTGTSLAASAQAGSPMRAAPVPALTGTPPLRPPAAAAAAPNSLISAAPAPSTIPATVPSAGTNNTQQPLATSRVTAGEAEDEGYYRNATYQLRNELAELKAQLEALQDQYRIAKEDRDTAENKYRLLLGEQAKASTTTAASASDSKNNAESQKDVLALWQERCSKKDETIVTLTARVEEQSAQVVALKDAAAAHEMALQTLRRRLKTAEEGVMVKSEEKREAEEKLAVAEDKLAAQMKVRLELENQVEELNSRVLVLTVEQDRLRSAGGNSDENAQMNSSFVSNGSVDRVMTLENELDEVRQQRDSLQRQVGVLQRQVAAMPAPVADVSTANDTWRAQLRQVEREREELRQQLTTALERNGDLRQQLAASAAAAATAVVANLSLGASRSSAAENGLDNSGAGPGAAGVNNTPSPRDGGELDMSALSIDSPRRMASNGSIGGKTRDAARREQVILSSLLLQYSYRNLLLQQHETLLHKDGAEAETARQHQAEEHLDIARHTPSSLLTKQRRDVEQGLLESVLHGAKLRMMRVEQ